MKCEYFEHTRVNHEEGPLKGAIEEWYLLNGLYHREDSPAYTLIDANGDSIERHYRHGVLHRSNGPCCIFRGPTEAFTLQYFDEGVLHRANGPAIVKRFENGNREERYFLRGEVRRVGGPAVVKFDLDGRVTEFSADRKIISEIHLSTRPWHSKSKPISYGVTL